MDKWLVLQPGCPPGLRQRIFDDRRQAYADAGDHLGVVLCLHAMKGRPAENAPDQHNDDSLGRIRGRLVDAIAAAIAKTTGVSAELSTGGGTSDGRFISSICSEVAEFGPINASIHKIDECVAVAELEPLTDIYQEVLLSLLGKG